MRRMALFAAVAAAVSLAVAVVVGAGGASGAVAPGRAALDAGGGHDRGIVGTWLVDVMPTGDEPLQAMLTLSPGGGLVETESSSPGTAQGSWKARGRGRVALTFQRFEFDAQGAPAGRIVVRAELTFRDGEWSGPFEFDFFDPQGAVVVSGSGTATAERFPVKPL
jgi:hypothetical protein